MAFSPRCGARQDEVVAPSPRRMLSGVARNDTRLRERLAAKAAQAGRSRLSVTFSPPVVNNKEQVNAASRAIGAEEQFFAGHQATGVQEQNNAGDRAIDAEEQLSTGCQATGDEEHVNTGGSATGTATPGAASVPPSGADSDKQERFTRALALIADDSPDVESLREAMNLFVSVGDYRSATQKAEQCRQALREPLYAEAQGLLATQQLEQLTKAKEIFTSLGHYRDAQKQAEECAKAQRQLMYAQVEDLLETAKSIGDYREALSQYQNLGDFKDALSKVALCQEKIASADKNKLKKRRRLKGIGSVLALVVGLSGLTVAFWRPVTTHIEYVKADRLLTEQRFLEAQHAFSALGGYSDSEAKLEACKEGLKAQAYARAEKLLLNRDFSGAMRAFAELGDYRDSRYRLQECGESAAANAYSLAVKAMDEGNYAVAHRQLREVGDLYDSVARRRECEYQLGLQKYEAGDLEGARPFLLGVGNYKDGLDLLNRCARATLESSLSELQVGGTLVMGRNPRVQANAYEALTWTVLERDENSLLVLAQNAVDCREYNPDSSKGLTWSDCELRRWLNEDFFYEAFSPSEQEYIVPNLLANPSSNLRNKEIYGGPPTLDKVFLLSHPEVDRLLGNARDRVCRFSDYAAERGTRVDRMHDAQGSWWLRSPGVDSNTAMRVEFDGSLGYDRFNVVYGVRPAVRVAFDPAYAKKQIQALTAPKSEVDAKKPESEATKPGLEATKPVPEATQPPGKKATKPGPEATVCASLICPIATEVAGRNPAETIKNVSSMSERFPDWKDLLDEGASLSPKDERCKTELLNQVLNINRQRNKRLEGQLRTFHWGSFVLNNNR